MGRFQKEFFKNILLGSKRENCADFKSNSSNGWEKKQFLVAEGGFEVISPILWGYLICTGKCFP